jgi:hypothetical protein
MIVAPCSMKTLAAIASGYAENLIGRAADVTLKEGKRLVLVPRESPLNPIHLENLLRLARLGVAIVPPIPPFYQLPGTVPELLDQIVGRILDQVGLHTQPAMVWTSVKRSTGRLSLDVSRLDICNHLAVLADHEGTNSLGQRVRAKKRIVPVQVFRLDMVSLLTTGEVRVEAGYH